ncbi:MAG: 4Fe-4S binding protein [Acidobacteria bacterium]|nr:4Fe-4S binding protein [Acidobacteriota bacterium]
MLTIAALLPAVLSCLLLGAHFYRAGSVGLAAACAAVPLLFLARRGWIATAAQGLLVAGAVVWLHTTVKLAGMRQAAGQPWLRMLLILGAVAAFTAGAALLLELSRVRGWFSAHARTAAPSAVAFLLAFGTLALIQVKVQRPLLLLERFVPGAGWIEALALAAYAAFLTEKLLDPAQVSRWRTRAWAIFSAVFFGQLALGLSGFETFLMTGKLHLPVPAMIVAGPLYRGGGLLMPILFGAALLLVGPAWCSHLCYIGAWDNALARTRRRPRPLPGWARHGRLAMLALVVLAALGLRWAGVPGTVAAVAGLAFGLTGVALMVLWSRRTGTMAHCIAFCPVGWLATTLGRVSPFRMRIGSSCTACNACTFTCRYDALRPEHLEAGRPGPNCTLCGDCLASCRTMLIEYRFPGLSPRHARAAFVVVVTVLQALFLGVARI